MSLPGFRFTVLSVVLSIVWGLPSVAPVLGVEAEDEADSPARTLTVESWLWLEPVTVALPVFHQEGTADFEVADLLEATQLRWERLWPAEGDEMTWPGGTERTWRETEASDGVLTLGPPDGETPAVSLAAVYLEVDRFTRAKLRLKSPHLLRIFLDGDEKGEKALADAPTEGLEEPGGEGEDFVGQSAADLVLTPGTHLVMVQALRGEEGPRDWSLAAELEIPTEHVDSHVELRTASRHSLRLTDLLDVDSIQDVSISAGGDLVALHLRHPMPPADFSQSWVDIRETKSGRLVDSYRGVGSLSSFRWGPNPEGHRYAFVERDEDEATLWVGDVDGGEMRSVLEGVKDLGGFAWVPGEASIVYWVEEEPDPKHEGIKRYQGLPDRWTTFRTKSHLHEVSVRDGITRRLTAGDETSALEDIAPDGRRLLFSRSRYTDAEWPFHRQELHELDLRTLESRQVRVAQGSLTARYSPDGRQVLILAGPTAFGDLGTNVPEGTLPNLYDTQAYLLDLDGDQITAITRDFDPTVEDAAWSSKDGSILFRAEAGSTTRLFRYEPKKASFEALEIPIDVVSGMSLSANGEEVVFHGTGLNTPQRSYVMPVKRSARARLLWAPETERFERVVTGEVEDFDFSSQDGTRVIGRVYLPPDFDPNASYPAIVYYYGGTSPVSRSFGGRYPKELWAAHGYVVYVLQPSGATGFGQEYSARHVNDWGKTVTGEIVQGTREFVEAHPFVDPERLGCIGASYGGFMTMLLITETDMFSAAISHAGISSLSSYWGEGWWGYLYSAAATAHSYPWNRPDLYVEQSALFRADEIGTPLLLLHGGADPNVPPGESEQMYTAMRVLGKDVEYVRIAGERHWILDYPKRKLWHQTILAYFDWKLKGQPAWWGHLFEADDE